PGGDQNGQHQRVKGDGLFRHAEGGAPQGEHQHQNGDEQGLLAPELGHQGGNAPVNGPGFAHNPQKPAHHEDKGGDVDGLVQPLQGGGEHRGDGLALLGNLLIGARHRLPLRSRLVASGGDDPGENGHHQQQGEENGVGGGHAKGFHSVPPYGEMNTG